MYKNHIKRILDIFLSLCGILILSPVYLILWVLVRRKLGKPALFTQERPGRNEKIFRLYKFRSMTDERDENGLLLPVQYLKGGYEPDRSKALAGALSALVYGKGASPPRRASGTYGPGPGEREKCPWLGGSVCL